MIEILVTLMVLSIAVVALIVTFATGISASVDHKNLAANNVVLRQVAEQAFYQIQQQSSPQALYTSCATNAPNGPYYSLDTTDPSNTYNNLPAGDTVTLNPIQYWDTTVSPAVFDGNCTPNSPQLISLTLGVPNGSSATTTFVVDDLGSGATSALSITSCSLTAPPGTPTPCSAIAGTSNLPVYLSGTGFANGATVSFSGPSGGITVNSTAFVTSTLLDLNISIAANATAGTYTATVTNPGGASASAPVFTVYAVIVTGMKVSGFSSFILFGIWPFVKVTVVDGNGHPLRHATVSGMWAPTAGGGFSSSGCTTDSTGSCYVFYGLFDFFPSPGSATYTVTNIVATGQNAYVSPTPKPSVTVSFA